MTTEILIFLISTHHRDFIPDIKTYRLDECCFCVDNDGEIKCYPNLGKTPIYHCELIGRSKDYNSIINIIKKAKIRLEEVRKERIDKELEQFKKDSEK